ncbi:MAG: anti-sigma factor [Myxococcota bacterium]
MSRITLLTCLAAAGCLAGLASACDSGDDEATTRSLALSFTGLEPLGGGYVYEGWLMVDGAPVSAGRFAIDATGEAVPATIRFDGAMADRATAYILTVEPGVGDDPAPSSTHVLAGDIAGGVATLTTKHGAALGTDFADATGRYILATPSTTTEDDDNHGIWWLVPGDAGMSPGLVLPTLPAGWAYEGWVAGAAGPISTGRFTDPAMTDSDAAGPTAGPDGAGPPFPGQDFITPALDLTAGYAAVISVEPDPDDSPAPFALKPLVHMSIGAVAKPATQSMDNKSAASPTGTVTIK